MPSRFFRAAALLCVFAAFLPFADAQAPTLVYDNQGGMAATNHYMAAWNSTTTYSYGDIVSVGTGAAGRLWYSRQSNNTGHTPAVGSLWWSQEYYRSVAPALQINGSYTTLQDTLNLIPGQGISLSDNGAGGVTIAAPGGGSGTPSSPASSGSYTTSRYFALTNAAYNSNHCGSNLNAACAFTDGSGSYFAAGGSFGNLGVFADDLTLAVIAAPDVFSAHTADLENIIGKFIGAANGNGEMPVGVAANGTAVTYWSSDDQKHNHASGDAQLMLPQLQFQSYLLENGSTAGVSAHFAALGTALSTVQTDSTGLCIVSSSDRWMPWLFEETAQHTGHDTMCSIWLARDYLVMAQMGTAAGISNGWGPKYTAILSSLSGTGSPLWNNSIGMYMMDDGALSTNVDVDGSALACYFGFATTAQCTAISNWLVSNYSSIDVGGFLRQSNKEFAACGGIDSNGNPVDNTGGLCAGGVYQSGGVWGVQLGWVLYTMGLTSPAAAQTLLNQALTGPGGDPRIEWYPYGGANNNNGGSDYNLESTMGFYDFARKGYSPSAGTGGATAAASAYPAMTQIGNTSLYLFNNGGGMSVTGTPGSNPPANAGITARALGIIPQTSNSPFALIYSVSGDNLVHFGDGTNDSLTWNLSTKTFNFINPPTGVSGGSSFTPGTPTMDSASAAGVSLVNNASWELDDQNFVIVAAPTSTIAAGSAFAKVDFGKTWYNTAGTTQMYPNCQATGVGAGSLGILLTYLGPDPKSPTFAASAALASGSTYIWNVHCSGLLEK